MDQTSMESRMLAHYIECALWCSHDWSDESDNNPETFQANGYDASDLAPAIVESMRADCTDFLKSNYDDLQEWIGTSPDGSTWYEIAGHNFWLTRNRHGAGFWDGDYPEEIGKRLTDAAHKYGECDLYVGDDGLIYLFGC